MPKYTGVDGRFLIEGVQVGGVKRFEVNITDVKSVPNIGQGDKWRYTQPVHFGWEGRGEFDFDIGTRATYMTLAATKSVVDFIGMIDAQEDGPTGFFAGQCRVMTAGFTVPFDDIATHSCEITGEGAPTIIDATPWTEPAPP